MLRPRLMLQSWLKLPHQCSSLGTVLDFPSKRAKSRHGHQPANAASYPQAIKDVSCQSQRPWHVLRGSPRQGGHPLGGLPSAPWTGAALGRGSLPVRTPQYRLPHRQQRVPASPWVNLQQTSARKDRREVAEPILALKDFAAGAERSRLVPPRRRSKGAALLGQLEPAPGMEHCAARRAFCWHAQHHRPKTALYGVLLPQGAQPQRGCSGRAPPCRRSQSLTARPVTFPTPVRTGFYAAGIGSIPWGSSFKINLQILSANNIFCV